MDRSTGSRSGARRKQEVVLRLLRGEGLDALARQTGQAAGTIAAWREAPEALPRMPSTTQSAD